MSFAAQVTEIVDTALEQVQCFLGMDTISKEAIVAEILREVDPINKLSKFCTLLVDRISTLETDKYRTVEQGDRASLKKEIEVMREKLRETSKCIEKMSIKQREYDQIKKENSSLRAKIGIADSEAELSDVLQQCISDSFELMHGRKKEVYVTPLESEEASISSLSTGSYLHGGNSYSISHEVSTSRFADDAALENEALRMQNGRVTKERDNLTFIVANQKEAIATRDAKIEALTKELAKRKEASNTEEPNKGTGNQLARSEVENEALRAKIAGLNEEREELNAKIKGMERNKAEKAYYEALVNKKEIQIDAQKTMIKDLTFQKEQLSKERTQYKAEIAKLTKDLLRSDSRLTQANDEIYQLKKKPAGLSIEQCGFLLADALGRSFNPENAEAEYRALIEAVKAQHITMTETERYPIDPFKCRANDFHFDFV